MPQVQKPLRLIHFWVNPFSHFQLWGNKKWDPQYKDQEIEKFWGQNQLYPLQMVQFECPGVRNPLVSSTFEDFPFPIFSPCSFLPSFLFLQYKELGYYGRLGKKVEYI